MTAMLSPDMRWGWRTVHPDFRSRNDFRWPFPGGWAEAPGPVLDHTNTCPRQVGDGLCVALDWHGAAMGGMSARNPILVVGWLPDDELGRDNHKVRIRRGYVADVWSAERILMNAPGAYLGGADLTGADLTGADLAGANLTGANLTGANLTGADLGGANLGGANLYRANLGGANLTGANLTRANLTGANLTGADLGGAYLTGAYLTGANLNRANLTGANLGGANLTGAYLNRANLYGANLGGANLVGAKGVPADVAARLVNGRHP